MKRFFAVITFAFLFFGGVFFVSEASSEVDAYLFHGTGCPHCAKEIEFFDSIKNKYPDLNLITYEVYFNRENALLLQEVATFLKAEGGAIPFLIIGDKTFIGFDELSTPVQIEKRINECLEQDYPNETGRILGTRGKADVKIGGSSKEDIKDEGEIGSGINPEGNDEKMIKLPFLGKKDIYKVSLPILAVLMGVLDGFNPCAMWVLIFLISLLLGMKDKKRMWTLGTAFIVASASVYFIFMAAWLNLILFLGIIIWVRLLIAGLALFGGGYSLKKFFKNKAGTCEVTEGEKKQKIFDKLKKIAKQNNLWLALGGIIILAFAVNLVELICSAGLPAVFTQVLAMNNLPKFSYYLYILLYIFFFMIDDLVVFFIAMFTLKMTGVTNKYARYSNLIGGVLMIVIGILLVFKPEWLMFG